jgi:hypothetical protein
MIIPIFGIGTSIINNNSTFLYGPNGDLEVAYAKQLALPREISVYVI